MAEKVPCLRLSLGGAPATWHTVDGLSGLFHPDIPVPVPEGADAMALSKDPGCPLERVLLSANDAESNAALLAEQLQSSRQALASESEGRSVLQVDAETAATGEKE
jgi:hypothetical protein